MDHRTTLNVVILALVSSTALPDLLGGGPWAGLDYVTATALVAAFAFFGVDLVRSLTGRAS